MIVAEVGESLSYEHISSLLLISFVCKGESILGLRDERFNNRRTRIKNRYKQCFRLLFVASRGTIGNKKTLFLTIFDLNSWIVLTFLIAT